MCERCVLWIVVGIVTGSLYIQLSIAIFFISVLFRMTWKFFVCVCVCVHACICVLWSFTRPSWLSGCFFFSIFLNLWLPLWLNCCKRAITHPCMCLVFNTTFFFCPQATNLRPIVTEYDSKKRGTKTELVLKKWVLQTCSINRNDVKIKPLKFMKKIEKSGTVDYYGCLSVALKFMDGYQ